MVAALAYNPGYLLVVAFDVVLAGCFVPLVAAVYWPSMTPNAGERIIHDASGFVSCEVSS